MKIKESRKSKVAHKFEDNYGKSMSKTCKNCRLPESSCTCIDEGGKGSGRKTNAFNKTKNKQQKQAKAFQKVTNAMLKRTGTSANMPKLKEAIKSLIYETINEASSSQIEQLVGKEAAIKYRKASGEVKGYFGRITKMIGDSFYMGVLGKGLRAFKVANVLDIRPVTGKFSEVQIAELDEMCGKVKEAKPGRKSNALLADIGRKKYGKEKFQQMAAAGRNK